MSVFKLSNIKIRDFIQSIENGKYQLPCFQRDFKWNPGKIKSLINSIQHEYPAGSLLFLSVDSEKPLIPYQEFKYVDKNKFTEKAEMLVLDGQQRMTSCYTIFTNTGYYSYYINFIELMNKTKSGEKDIDFETLIVHKRRNQNPGNEISNGLFPMAYLRDRDIMREQIKLYLFNNQSDPNKAEECTFLSFDFGKYVDPILDYEFPVVELPENSSMESVCKVFQTINTTGLKLSVFDICVAVFMPSGINLKANVNKSISKTDYAKRILQKDPTSALQVIALLANKAPNLNTLPNVLEAQDISDYWDDAIKGMENALMLFDSFGSGTKKNLAILPYAPLVTIVAAVLSRTKYSRMSVPKKAKTEQKIKAFFFTAALTSRYTEGTNAKINEDFKSLNLWISNDQIPAWVTHGVDWNTPKIVENNKNGAFGKAVLCMLNSGNLTDFYTNDKVGIGEHIDSCDLHHIFPKAQYESQYDDKIINSVFNFTWLTKETNNYIKDKNTNKYLADIMSDSGKSEDQLKALLSGHIVSDEIYEAMKKEDYITFINKRADKIKSLFENAGVTFRDVDADDLEVEDDSDDEESEE